MPKIIFDAVIGAMALAILLILLIGSAKAQYKPQQLQINPPGHPPTTGFIVDPANKQTARIWRSGDMPRDDNVVAEVPAQCLASYDLLTWCIGHYKVAK